MKSQFLSFFFEILISELRRMITTIINMKEDMNKHLNKVKENVNKQINECK
jgi:hypothetical protein